MYCPFQKTTTNMNDSHHPISAYNKLIVSVEENLMNALNMNAPHGMKSISAACYVAAAL